VASQRAPVGAIPQKSARSAFFPKKSRVLADLGFSAALVNAAGIPLHPLAQAIANPLGQSEDLRAARLVLASPRLPFGGCRRKVAVRARRTQAFLELLRAPPWHRSLGEMPGQKA